MLWRTLIGHSHNPLSFNLEPIQCCWTVFSYPSGVCVCKLEKPNHSPAEERVSLESTWWSVLQTHGAWSNTSQWSPEYAVPCGFIDTYRMWGTGRGGRNRMRMGSHMMFIDLFVTLRCFRNVLTIIGRSFYFLAKHNKFLWWLGLFFKGSGDANNSKRERNYLPFSIPTHISFSTVEWQTWREKLNQNGHFCPPSVGGFFLAFDCLCVGRLVNHLTSAGGCTVTSSRLAT